MSKNRTETDIVMVQTARKEIHLGPRQVFYETPKAYEIWEKKSPYFLRFIARINKKRVLWTFTEKDRIVI